MTIRLELATITPTEAGCTVRFNDGATIDSCAHPDMPHYHVIAHRCGYGDDVVAYCREHDFCHLFLAERLFQSAGILWPLANGFEVPPNIAALEEIAVQAFQRWLRANERPIVGNVDWDGLKRDALALLEGSGEDREPRPTDE